MPFEMTNATATANLPSGENTPAISPPRPYAPDKYESPAVESPCTVPAAMPATAPPASPPTRAQTSTVSTMSTRPTEMCETVTFENESSKTPSETITAATSPLSNTAVSRWVSKSCTVRRRKYAVPAAKNDSAMYMASTFESEPFKNTMAMPVESSGKNAVTGAKTGWSRMDFNSDSDQRMAPTASKAAM